MKKQKNSITKETIQVGYENIYSRPSKLLAESLSTVVFEFDKEYTYDS